MTLRPEPPPTQTHPRGSLWRRHPGVRAGNDLTRGERAADLLRNGMGSWSCLAAMQGAILLIAAKREDQISSELAVHDYETNLEADAIVKAIHELTRQIHAEVCVGGPSTVVHASEPDHPVGNSSGPSSTDPPTS